MQKYLRMSKKSSTFAAAFVKRHCDAPSGGSRGDTSGCHRITVSTQDFHSCNRGSIPLGTTRPS